MTILKTKAEEAIEREIKYHKKQVKYYKEYKQQKRHIALAEKLESSLVYLDEVPDVYISQYGSITLKFTKPEIAREFVEKVMDKLHLDKIDRQMETYSSEPKWFYHIPNIFIDCEGKADNYYLSVYPAKPVEGCNPRRVAQPREPNYKWVCERGEVVSDDKVE